MGKIVIVLYPYPHPRGVGAKTLIAEGNTK